MKRRSVRNWAIAGLLTGPLALLVVLFLPVNLPPPLPPGESPREDA